MKEWLASYGFNRKSTLTTGNNLFSKVLLSFTRSRK